MKKQINHKFKIHRKRAHNHSKNKAKKQKKKPMTINL